MQQRRKRLARRVRDEIVSLTAEIAGHCNGCPYSGCQNSTDDGVCGFVTINTTCKEFKHVCNNHNSCESDSPKGWAEYYSRNRRGKGLFNNNSSFPF